MAKVAIDPATGCWNWQGWISKQGYGQFTPQHGHKEGAHRWAYTHWRQTIPTGLVIDHLCRNRACVNPAHLDAVTNLENLRRSPNFSGHKTHCDHGHEFTPTNTYIDKRGHRDCRACAAAKQRRMYRERKQHWAATQSP